MLKIYYNTKSNADIAIKLEIKGSYCRAEVKQYEDVDNDDAQNTEKVISQGADVIENMLPYNSYVMTAKKGKVKIYRQISSSAFKWLDLNRLGVAIKMDFANIGQLYGTRDIIQVDTGIMVGEVKDVVVRLFEVNIDKLEVDADQEYELLPFNSDDLVLGDHPRMSLWDSYSLSACGHEFKANRKGFPVEGDFEEALTSESGSDYIEFTIQKYKGNFTEKLTRDIDDEEVMVECSAGLCNNRRVRLQNGKGCFRVYPFGHTGAIKIKLGRKWYEVWNDYGLRLGGED